MAIVYIAFCDTTVKETKQNWEHRIGRTLLRRGLREATGLDIDEETLETMLSFSSCGKPRLKKFPAFSFNISHCAGAAVCACGKYPIGVDIERIRPVKDSFVRRMLSVEEQEQCSKITTDALRLETIFRYWTAKESFLKWTGEGLYRAPDTVAITLEDTDGRPSCEQDGVRFYSKRIKEEYLLTLCADAREEVTEGFLVFRKR